MDDYRDILYPARKTIGASCVLIAKIILLEGRTGDAHHRQWVLDQVLRMALGKFYSAVVEAYNADEDFEKWDEGIAP